MFLITSSAEAQAKIWSGRSRMCCSTTHGSRSSSGTVPDARTLAWTDTVSVAERAGR